MTKLHSFEMWAYLKMMKISWREKKTNEEVLTLADEQLYIIPTIKKRKITYFGNMIRRNYIHRLLLEGHGRGKKQRKAENGVVLNIVSGTAEAGTETNDWVCILTSFNRIGKRQPWSKLMQSR